MNKIPTQIRLSKAKSIAKANGIEVSDPTFLKWIKDNGLGHQPGGAGGTWYIYKDKFTEYIKGVKNGKG